MASTVWRGYISFGLISIPVRLFRAARAERVSLRRLYRAEPGPTAAASAAEREGPEVEPEIAAKPISLVRGKEKTEEATAPPVLEPVRQASVRGDSETVVPGESVVKGYEYEKDRYVALETEELKSIVPKTSEAMEIEEFVPLGEVDPVYFETSYYVVPEEAGEKAYALLHRSLQTTGLIAIAHFAMHSREHVALVRPGKYGLLAHTMFFQSEVRAEEEHHADISAVKEKELSLAEKLIHSLATSFEPEKYKDAYRQRLQELIDRKIQGLPAAPAAAARKRAEVVDMAEALERSLANLKKPAASAASVSEEKAETSRPRARKLPRRAGAS
jgi:DNA end-binding protein Ku